LNYELNEEFQATIGPPIVCSSILSPFYVSSICFFSSILISSGLADSNKFEPNKYKGIIQCNLTEATWFLILSQ
jgi:hypothetical protein